MTEYVLETKTRFSARWTKLTTDSIEDTQFTVKNLKEGEEYQYRVIALNKKGESQPSTPTGLIKTGFDFGEY